MNQRMVAIALALLVGFLVGLGVGRRSGPEYSAPVETPEAMATALRAAFVEPDPMVRARDMERLMNRLDARNLPGAIEVFREFATSSETLGVSEFFARWSRIDVESLVREMDSWPDERARAQGMSWVVYQLAYQDGTARAITFYNGLPGGLRLVSGYRLVEGALNGGDEAGLIEWIAAQDDMAERNRLIQSAILKLLREEGAEGPLRLFERIPRDSRNQFKRQAFLVTLDKLTRHDVSQALAFREAHADAPYAQNSLVQLAVAWTDIDPTAALGWLEELEPGPDRDRALEATIDRWGSRDERAAIEWTLTQPPSPMVDRLCRQFASANTIRNPELAADLASRIQDREMRWATLRGIARYWFTRKPPETHDWLVRGGLTQLEAEAMIDELAATRERRLGSQRGDGGPG